MLVSDGVRILQECTTGLGISSDVSAGVVDSCGGDSSQGGRRAAGREARKGRGGAGSAGDGEELHRLSVMAGRGVVELRRRDDAHRAARSTAGTRVSSGGGAWRETGAGAQVPVGGGARGQPGPASRRRTVGRPRGRSVGSSRWRRTVRGRGGGVFLRV